MLPTPKVVTPGPTRVATAAPNRIEGPCSDRLRRAAGRLPPLGLCIAFEVASVGQAVPRLSDSYGYRLLVGDDVTIKAPTEWGAIAALATLTQLCAEGSVDVLEVRDAPRYPWRGLMIDTVRHFSSLATLERTLDAMAFYKLNVLHLHLTDDQGFRFQSQAYPELASEQSYSQSELRGLVDYAADRAIRIVPELDVPGHATSWLAAHPEWGTGDVAAVHGPSTRFGVHDACLDMDNRDVLTAVDALLGELAAVFPDECLHFGGDEVGRDCTALHRRIVATVTSLGRRAVGWDECLHPGLPHDTVIQAWRGIGARDASLDAGYDCVVSAPYYLDLFYPADVHYAFDPANATADDERAMLDHPGLEHVRHGLDWMSGFATFDEMPSRPGGRVLGGEACLWAELVDDSLLDTRVWSRMPAIAERFWNGGASDIEDVYQRMATTRRTLAELGVVGEDNALQDAYPDLAPLIEMIEPVKWYLRLLGVAEFQRRVSGLGGASEKRPYDTSTPLDRIVDRIAPESLATRCAAADLARGTGMDHWLEGWRRQRQALKGHPELDGELREVSTALARIADAVDGLADAKKLGGPFGEYVLPIAHAVAGYRRSTAYRPALRALESWGLDADLIRPIDTGHINDTYLVGLVGERHLLQRLNRSVFRNPEAVMRNLARALAHEGGDVLVAPVDTTAGATFARDVGGDIWRLFPHLPSRNFQSLPGELLANAGYAFGGFLAAFADFTGDLEPVIDGFHDLSHYLSRLDDAPDGDVGTTLDEMNALRARFRPGKAERVIHGDCKVNNLLFHPTANDVVAIIDLDTLMFGDPAWDFGDLVRSAFAGSEETEAAVAFSRARFEPLCRGFFSAFGSADDIARYAAAPAYMSFMLSVRFLTDHLERDIYFKVAKRGDNLARARSQLDLANRFIAAEPAMARTIATY